jgi:pimeloyl-ACP methyl ester carboxylesterase
MPTVKANDLNVHYIERGAGEPIVFVHGNWATAGWWEPTLEQLPDGWRGIAPDMRGRGGTTGPDSGYAIPSLAADLLAFADALGLEAFHLVGHSLGSAVAMQAALDQPERIRTLTVVAPAWVDGMPEAFNAPEQQLALKANPAIFEQAMRAIIPAPEDPALFERLLREGIEQTEPAALHNLDALLSWKPGDSLRDLPMPKLVVNGANDVLTGGAVAERAAQALGARHEVLPAVAHAPNLEAVDAWMRLLLDHVTQARS